MNANTSEIKNELLGTIELLMNENTNENDTRAIELFNELIADLRKERETLKTTTTKLTHKKLQNEIEKELNIPTERFDLSYDNKVNSNPTYKYLLTSARDFWNNENDLELWKSFDFSIAINYTTKNIVVYTSTNNNTFNNLVNSNYSNKGFTVSFTNNSKWAI